VGCQTGPSARHVGNDSAVGESNDADDRAFRRRTKGARPRTNSQLELRRAFYLEIFMDRVPSRFPVCRIVRWGLLLQSTINQGSIAVCSLLESMLDFRKRLRVIDEILKSRGFDESKTFKRIHALHDVRNTLAHYPFDEDGDRSGIYCSEFDKFFRYAELDSYDAELSTLFVELEKLKHSDAATPITDLSSELQVSIERAISSSDNIVQFPIGMQRPKRQDAGWSP